jgi:hypothetical protein
MNPAPGLRIREEDRHMAIFGRDHDRLRVTQLRAINHPCRLRILEMHQWARGWPLSVEVLTDALAETREFHDVTAAKVTYHLTRLQDAGLLPRSR